MIISLYVYIYIYRERERLYMYTYFVYMVSPAVSNGGGRIHTSERGSRTTPVFKGPSSCMKPLPKQAVEQRKRTKQTNISDMKQRGKGVGLCSHGLSTEYTHIRIQYSKHVRIQDEPSLAPSKNHSSSAAWFCCFFLSLSVRASERLTL